MTIDITPEAVEQLARLNENGGTYDTQFIGYAAVLRALSAALTASQAETAAAYEYVAAMVVGACGDASVNDMFLSEAIRALTPADSNAALDRIIVESRADGMREAATIANTLLMRATFGENVSAIVTYSDFVGATILAAIPKGKDHE